MTKEEAIKYLEKRKEKALMLMENSKADTPINNKVRGILTQKIEALDMAISALKGGWIPITTRPMTEEEITSYDYYNYFFFIDEPRIMDCKLPDDGEEVEVTINGKVVVDTFYNDGNEGCYFDTVDIEDVTAWRPCEPYVKPEEGERE